MGYPASDSAKASAQSKPSENQKLPMRPQNCQKRGCIETENTSAHSPAKIHVNSEGFKPRPPPSKVFDDDYGVMEMDEDYGDDYAATADPYALWCEEDEQLDEPLDTHPVKGSGEPPSKRQCIGNAKPSVSKKPSAPMDDSASYYSSEDE